MRFKIARTHIIAGEYISEGAQLEIQKIIDNLSTASTFPNKLKETEIIRSVCQRGEMKKVKLTYVDIYLENHNGEIFLFDLKTTKPNVGGFKEFKRTMLEWIAAVLARN
jgi:type II restriction enzyme